MKRSLFAILVLSLVAAAAPAEAARPILGAKYRGETSQDARLTLRIAKDRREIRNIQALLATRCTGLGTLTTQGVDVAIRVRRSGRFANTFIEVAMLEDLFDPVVLAGRRRNVFDVTKSRLSGRFVTRRRVRGTWRVRSTVYDEDQYPDNVTPLDRCSTGAVGYSAKRVRRRR